MGPGMFDEMWKGLVTVLALLGLLLFAMGWGCSAGCRAFTDHYDIRIERSGRADGKGTP